MKLATITVLLLTILAVSPVRAEIINAEIMRVGEDTLITCTTQETMEIEQAILTIYASDGSMLSVLNREMEISAENTATFRLVGHYAHLDGKCQLFLAEEASQRISLSMLFNQ